MEEMYAKKNPDVRVAVSGGGSGTGIAGIINGVVDIANCSRAMKPGEAEKVKEAHGVEASQFIMGLDCLAVYVHKDNPLEKITIEQLGQIFGEDGTITKWSQLGVDPPEGKDEIVRLSRQSNSGTYVYFKETVIPEGKSLSLDHWICMVQKKLLNLPPRHQAQSATAAWVTPRTK